MMMIGWSIRKMFGGGLPPTEADDGDDEYGHQFQEDDSEDDDEEVGSSKSGWLRRHPEYILCLLYPIMVACIFLIWYLLVLIATHSLGDPDPGVPNATATDVSFRIYSNGSVLVSNVSMELPSSPLPQPMDAEQERILARERIKQGHLNYIRDQLMNILLAGRTPPANVTVASPATKDAVRELASAPIFPVVAETVSPPSSLLSTSSSSSDIYAQRLQSFYPSCGTVVDFLKPITDDPDQNQDQEDNGMKLYFDLVTIPRSRDDRRPPTRVTVMWAKLRLWMLEHRPLAQCTETGTVSCPDLVVSVYRFVPPFKQNRRARTRLVDRRTVPGNYRSRLDFNLESAVNDWHRNNQLNYGLVVRVRDQFGSQLSAANFLHRMNCSDPVLPIPNLAAIYGDQSSSDDNPASIHRQRVRYPSLDLMTVEVAKQDDEFVNDKPSHISAI